MGHHDLFLMNLTNLLKKKNLNLSCRILQNQFNPLQSVNGVCVSKSFPIHRGKNCCSAFSSTTRITEQVPVCDSAKWCTEVGLFPHAWVY